MRPRFLIFTLLIALLVLALLFWRRPVRLPSTVEQPQVAKQSTNAPVAQANPVSKNTPVVAPKPTANQPVVNNIRTPEGFKQYIEGHNKPVDFYGLVIDQDSNALSGVDIKVAVRHWTMRAPNVLLSGSTTIPLEATTGPDGRFELTGATGDGFDIESFQKDGYERESGQRGFGAESGSYANPDIFKMWSTNIHEKLITGKYAFKIVPDGRPYFINLTDGTISESGLGDLKVWIQYTNHIVPGQMSDWSTGIVVSNGGLRDAPDYAMWMAPTDGYVPSFQESGQIRGGQSGEIGDRRFYLKLQNGSEYGHMTIDLIAPYNFGIPGLVRLSYAINPSGSRILR